jgi:hypothetical protein
MINQQQLPLEAPMRHRLVMAMLAAVATCACSQETLNSERAASLISGTHGFKREAQFTIQTDAPMQSAFECLAQAEVERMPLHRFVVERGWVRYEARNASLGFGKTASCPSMALTPAGQAASATWTRGRVASAPEGVAWSVPIGRRELIGAPRLTTASDESVQVQFDWNWAPNDTGLALRQAVERANLFFDQKRTGRASCRRFDEGWRCELALWKSPADAGEFQP